MALFGPNVEKLKAKRDYQGLIKALEYKQDPNVQMKAEEALRDTPAIEPLIILLNSGEANLSQTAARFLGKIGAPAVIPLITKLTTERGWADRAPFGLEAETKLKWKNIRRTILGILVGIGKPAVSDLIAVVSTDMPYGTVDIRKEAVQALGEIGDVQAVEPLKTALGKLNQEKEGNKDKVTRRINNTVDKDQGVLTIAHYVLEREAQEYRDEIERALEKIANAEDAIELALKKFAKA
jgi:HEAT repeat protein